jgi:hypothetical protein
MTALLGVLQSLAGGEGPGGPGAWLQAKSANLNISCGEIRICTQPYVITQVNRPLSLWTQTRHVPDSGESDGIFGGVRRCSGPLAFALLAVEKGGGVQRLRVPLLPQQPHQDGIQARPLHLLKIYNKIRKWRWHCFYGADLV